MGVFIHPNSLCESATIGDGTRVWAFAHVLPQAIIGRDCNICDHVFVENDVVIGDRVTIKCGVQLWDGVRLEDDVFIGPNVTFTNDKFPRSRCYLDRPLQTLVRRGASIGANSTILPNVEIGERAMVGAGSVVTRNIPPMATVMGNPARIVGYVDTAQHDGAMTSRTAPTDHDDSRIPSVRTTSVADVTVHRLPQFKDLRGSLSVGEFSKEIPFIPQRYFFVFGVSSTEVRGEHAHRECEQFLICAHGACALLVDDGSNREEILLNRPDVGVYLPPMTWGIQYKYTSDALLLVFASHAYDNADYIRDYRQFLNEAHISRKSVATPPFLKKAS